MVVVTTTVTSHTKVRSSNSFFRTLTIVHSDQPRAEMLTVIPVADPYDDEVCL